MAQPAHTTVCVATYGDVEWGYLATRRALPSAQVQGCEVIYVHSESLHEARNRAAEVASGEWLVFLDADDELAPGYVDAMMAHTEATFIQPAVQYVYTDRAEPPVILPPKPLDQGNYLVIGTAVRRDLFMEVGGFKDWPIYEDWDLWLRCADHVGEWSVSVAADAVYRAHVRPHSRNEPDERTKRRYYNAIRAEHIRRRRA